MPACCSLGAACCQAVLSPAVRGHSFILRGLTVLHRHLMCWTLVDSGASFVVRLTLVQTLVGYHPHFLLPTPPPHPAASCFRITTGIGWLVFITRNRMPLSFKVKVKSAQSLAGSPRRTGRTRASLHAAIHSGKFLFLLFTQSSGGNSAKLLQVGQTGVETHPTSKLSHDESVETIIHSFFRSFLFIHSLQECLPKCFLDRGRNKIGIMFIACPQRV